MKRHSICSWRLVVVAAIFACVCLIPAAMWAQEEAAAAAAEAEEIIPPGHLSMSAIDKADTAFLILSAALVMLMTPALALFYGGLVRTKNVLSVLMHCFIALGVITLTWITLGYSLAFSPPLIKFGEYTFLGGFDWIGLRGAVHMNPSDTYASTVPHRLFMIYQCMFAVITPALIAGAVAERMKFKAYLVFIVLWSLLVYSPLAHWVWGGGWLYKIGSLDFAGGAVVHMTSGFTALLVALMIKPRRGFPREAFLPHNLVLTTFGAGLLWFGWFGFNAGSAVESGSIAVVAFVATHIAAALGAVGWTLYDWITKDKPTILGTASGAVSGLVAITPAAGFVGPLSAAVIGLVAGVVCAMAVTWRARRGIDDALDAFGVHGIGGTLGAIMTGLFASAYLNSAVEAEGLLRGGGFTLLNAQLIACAATIAYTLIVSYVILKAIDLTIGLRVTTEEEQMGLDLTQHGEAAYNS